MRTVFINAVLPNGASGITVSDGRITSLETNVEAGDEVIDCKGKMILPGAVDMRVFTGEPGSEYRETLATASQAAAAGGVTTMVLMPNTNPVIDDAAMVDFLLRRARDTASVNVACMAAITKGTKGAELAEIGLMREAGAVAITDGTRSIANANLLRRVMTYARDHGIMVVQHVEEPSLATGVMNAGEMASRLGLSGSSAMAEVMMLERDLRLVEMTGATYHAAQISCAESVEVMRCAKAKGLPVSCGVSVNHLTLNEIDIGAYRTFFKISPPLRKEDDRRALVDGLADGTIDVIVSGHDPQSEDTKRLPFAEAAFGAVGLDTLWAAAFSLYLSKDISLARLCDVLSEVPARLLGLPAQGLNEGASADFIIFDPDHSWTIEPQELHSRSKNSPFEHRNLEGKVLQTYVAGKKVYAYAS